MDERRGTLLVEGRLEPGVVRFESGRIAEVEIEPGVAAPGAPLIAPGLVDLHVHGFGGHGPLDDLAGMAHALARAGTTAFVPTLFPDEPAALGPRARGVSLAGAKLGPGTAHVLGVHLEGPFVNPERAGALPRHKLHAPSVAGLRALLGPATGGGNGVRIVTLAPELEGSAELIEELARAGVRVSLGHSRARADDARRAASRGATGVTHLFNAMEGLHHREVGLLGFALSQDALCAEIIGDLVHVGADAFRLALRARGPGGLALVSDALRGAGTGCDVFEDHGHSLQHAEGAFWLDDEHGRRLAGAAASQLEAVRRLVRGGVLGPAEALLMASETPARALGLENELGRLAGGARADLLLLDRETLELQEVLLRGEPLGSASGPVRSIAGE